MPASRVNTSSGRDPKQRDALADPSAVQAERDRRDRGLCVARAGGEPACPN